MILRSLLIVATPYFGLMLRVQNTTHCQSLQRNVTPCNTLRPTLEYTVPLCNTLQHTATPCDTLQHTVAHCNTLQQRSHSRGLRWLQAVGSSKLHVSFAKEPYKRDYILSNEHITRQVILASHHDIVGSSKLHVSFAKEP